MSEGSEPDGWDDSWDDRELWFGSATSRRGVSLGQTVLRNVHPRRVCFDGPCALHNPSEHHMREWPTNFRGDRGQMERLCPHGTGHPDPDDLAWHVSQGRGFLAEHDCDGCCAAAPGGTISEG